MQFFHFITIGFRNLLNAKKQGVRLGLGVTVALVVLLSINLGISISQQEMFQQVAGARAFDFTIHSNQPQEAYSIYRTLRDDYDMPVTNVSGINFFGHSIVMGY